MAELLAMRSEGLVLTRTRRCEKATIMFEACSRNAAVKVKVPLVNSTIPFEKNRKLMIFSLQTLTVQYFVRCPKSLCSRLSGF